MTETDIQIDRQIIDIQIDRQIIVRDRLQTKIEHKDRLTDKMKVGVKERIVLNDRQTQTTD